MTPGIWMKSLFESMDNSTIAAADQDGDVIEDLKVLSSRDQRAARTIFSEDSCADKEKNHFGLSPTNPRSYSPPCEGF